MMKKQLQIRRIGKLLCLLLAVALLVSFSMILCTYYDYNKLIMEGFYAEPEDTLDVVLVGASEVFTGFSSAYAYELHGFTSYPYALDATTSTLYESQVREILKKQDPDWIVIEVNGLLYDDPQMHTDEGGLRRFLDNIPFSLNKVSTIMDQIPQEEWINYLFPLAKYHSNWKGALDQGGRIKDVLTVRLRGHSLLKGNVTTVNTFVAPAMMNVTGDTSTEPLETQSQQHLICFLEFCRENQLENVLFVRFPHIISDDWSYRRFQRCNEAERIIQEYGYDFVNMERDHEKIGLDFSADFYNEDHVNLTGQRKLTEYFSRILAEDYAVGPSALSEKHKENWETAAEYNQLFYEYTEGCRQNGQYDVYYETYALIDALTAMRSAA